MHVRNINPECFLHLLMLFYNGCTCCVGLIFPLQLQLMVRLGVLRFENVFICLFVWVIDVPFENCYTCMYLMWKFHHYRWKAANFDLYSALIAIEQGMFFNVPHLLWLGPILWPNWKSPKSQNFISLKPRIRTDGCLILVRDRLKLTK